MNPPYLLLSLEPTLCKVLRSTTRPVTPTSESFPTDTLIEDCVEGSGPTYRVLNTLEGKTRLEYFTAVRRKVEESSQLNGRILVTQTLKEVDKSAVQVVVHLHGASLSVEKN